MKKGARKGAKYARKAGKTGEHAAPVIGAMLGDPETGSKVGEISGHIGKAGSKSHRLLR